MFSNYLVPLLFLMFLVIYQAAPDSYYEIIDETFKGIDEKFEEKYEISYESQDATLKTVIFLFLKSVLIGAFAFAVLVAWLASIVPFSAEFLLYLFFAVMVISAIPWGIILGFGLLVKDWWNKKRGGI